MERQLSVSFNFLKIYMNLSEQPPHCHPEETSDKEKINYFISAFLNHGFGDSQHFPGRLKESSDIDTDDPQFLKKVTFAREHRLWHYHIGIPCYEEQSKSNRGNWLSAYLLNLQKFLEDYIKLVDLNSHPPFVLPKAKSLEGEAPIAKPKLRVIK